ncbi:MAG TPA: TetR/AcrR family transcriptional regulator [Microthrixaceae bacterium]|jgi:AcrR family transcriptional regulator|nr:TetR/AcrR family transcriptional regulator [Microthrixaceae bacterium]
MTTEERGSGTRTALLDAGLELIAERGFDSVTVGDIEERAGFVRRGGTLYKHFASKQDLLDEGVRRHVESLAKLDGLDDLGPLPDRRSELIVLGRWILRRLSNEETVSRIIEKEGHRLPGIVAQMRDGVSEAGYGAMAGYLRRSGVVDDADPDALAVVLLGSLVNLRRSAWTFGRPPSGVDDERAGQAWATVVEAVIDAEGTPESVE